MQLRTVQRLLCTFCKVYALVFFLTACDNPRPKHHAVNRATSVPPLPAPGEPGKPVPPRSDTPLLGAAPFCEPSATVPSPWHPGRTIVADNELHGELYTFALEAGRLVDPRPLEMASKSKPRDIEALTVVGDQLLVFGSHSRNWLCEPRPKRQRSRLMRYEPEDDELAHVRLIDAAPSWSAAAASPTSCVSTLFVESSPLAERFCQVFVEAEHHVIGDPEVEYCPALNIEGAVTLEGRVWIGLRAPLVDGQAVLLRLESGLERFRFDAIALVDLNGRGVRELALHEGVMWAIAGPTDDTRAPFLLRALETLPGPELTLTSTEKAQLPTSSEGLVFDGDHVIVVIDGAEGEDDDRPCDVPAGQERVRLE